MVSCPNLNDDTFGPVVQGCRSNFDFTLLFEQSILSIGPAALLLLFAPSRLRRLFRSSNKTLSSWVRSLKFFVCLLLVGVQLGLLITWSSNRVTKATLPSAILSFLASTTLLALSSLEDSRAIRPSSLINIYLLFSLAFDAVQVRTLYLRNEDDAILGLFTADVAIKTILLLLESRNKRKYLKSPYNDYSPETTSGIFSQSFFWWINPVLATGFRKILTLDDLFKTDPALLSEPLSRKIEISWNKYRFSGKYPLVSTVFHCLRWSLAKIVFPRLCLIGFNYAQPFLISSAINYVSHPGTDKNSGYGLIGATVFIYLGIAVSTTHYKHCMYRAITCFRGATVSLIYAKTLQVQAGGYDESAALTLMSTDMNRLATSLEALCEAWARLIELTIGLWLLGRQLGWVCVAPVVVVAGSIFFSGKVTRRIGPRQGVWVKAIQRRVGMTASMLGSMKSVKMMGLSDILFDNLQNERVHELNLSKKFRVMNIYRLLLSFLPPIVGPLATYVIFAIQASVKGSDRLSTSETFSSLAIISLLTDPAQSFLLSLPMIGMSTGCLKRIQDFLLAESCEDNRILFGSSSNAPSDPGTVDIELQSLKSHSSAIYALSVENATIRPSSDAPPAITDVSFQAVKASLTMVIGVVGSGKSTLLKGLIGELKCDSGEIYISSRRTAYCSQSPWLQNATVRSIITGFSERNDEDLQWYKSVLHACAFDEDVSALPDQDDTLIGSRGVTLSGGQKQRLALARAVYARPDIVVLDDVLSAVDVRVEQRVVDRLFGEIGLFRKLGSTVVLATHAIKHLSLADNIIVLDPEGKILEQGSLEDLRSKDGFVSRILEQPQILSSENSKKSKIGDDASERKQAKPISKALQGPSANDIADLTRQTGDIKIYKYYIKSIGWKLLVANISTSLLLTLGSRFPPLWLTFYSEGTVKSLSLFASIYTAAAVIGLLGAAGTLYTLYMKITPKSGAGLHKWLLYSVMHAPQSFFDKTDTGVTLNRFSQDMTLIDGSLPNAAVMASSSFLDVLAQFGLVAFGSSYVALICPFLMVVIYILQKFYLRTSRQIRFLDLECTSPLYTHFGETLEGVSIIRSFGWQDRFAKSNIEYLDASQKPFYMMYCIQRWISLVLQLLVGIVAVSVMALAVNLRNSTSAGRLGVSLSAIVSFNGSLILLLYFWTQLETSIGAVARVKSFEETTELEDTAEESFVPGEEWPANGSIEFQNVSASYGPNIPALKDISLSIKPGEKIGICGRTGSGKSTLISTLLRIVDLDTGSIKIDSLSLSQIPRSTIRSRIITIPQDPFLLPGTVRYNLFPTTTNSSSSSITSPLTDAALIDALQKVNLWTVLSPRGGLDADISTTPLSSGQQQIFSLARAVLRARGRAGGVLVLDEAMSSVDSETEGVMKRVVEDVFASWTVVMVAHRLGSLRDVDRVVVVDAGRVVRTGRPEEVLSAFAGGLGGDLED